MSWSPRWAGQGAEGAEGGGRGGGGGGARTCTVVERPALLAPALFPFTVHRHHPPADLLDPCLGRTVCSLTQAP